MRLKPIAATMTVLLVVVASLLVSGCSTTTNNTNQPSATTAAHDAFLESYIAAYKSNRTADNVSQLKAWDVTWINSTSARVQYSALNKSTNQTMALDEMFIVFPASQDATNYLNTMNLTAYSLASTQYPAGGAYEVVTGHGPQTYKEYIWNEGSPFNISEYTLHEIVQLNNIIVTITGKIV